MSEVEWVQLRRENAANKLVPWTLVSDGESPTGLADPTIDQGVRDRLDTISTTGMDAFGREFRSADERPSEIRYAETLTTTATITPAAGTKIRIRKIGWLAQSTPNSVTLRWADTGSGVKNIWKAVATQQTVYETGATDRVLEIVLSGSAPVDVNVHYEEI